jgi:hypothetical protein
MTENELFKSVEPSPSIVPSIDQAAAVNLLHELQEAAKELARRVDAALPNNTEILVYVTIYDGEKSPELLEAAKLSNWHHYKREGTTWFSTKTEEPQAQVTIFYE